MRYSFLTLLNIVYDQINNVPMFMGQTSEFYPVYESTDPWVLPYRGLYFSGSAFATARMSAA